MKIALQCHYNCCKLKPWLNSFESQEDLQQHYDLHRYDIFFPIRCQMLVVTTEGSYKQCDFIPMNEQELINHMEMHIKRDASPSQVCENGAVIYYCPFQTCSSISYSIKGTVNRGHLMQHIRKHCRLSGNDYSKRNESPVPSACATPKKDKSPSNESEGQENMGVLLTYALSRLPTENMNNVDDNPLKKCLISSLINAAEDATE